MTVDLKPKLVCDIAPKENSIRNSEGAFLKAPNGDILFAYSCFTDDAWDHSPSNIKMTRSSDNGETWSDEHIMIAPAAHFGVKNVMSVSSVYHKNGDLSFYFCIKENDLTISYGRAISKDGGATFTPERVKMDMPGRYYLSFNDRIIRTSDGRLAVSFVYGEDGCNIACVAVSEDDGESFHLIDTSKTSLRYYKNPNLWGEISETGLIEIEPGKFWMWMRTEHLFCQYISYSEDNLQTFSQPEPSMFSSCNSPCQFMRVNERQIYIIYNPIPNYNGRADEDETPWGRGRTPLMIRKSLTNGREWGSYNIIQQGKGGYCYPSACMTDDGALLVSYCRGEEEDKLCLCRLGIVKIYDHMTTVR